MLAYGLTLLLVIVALSNGLATADGRVRWGAWAMLAALALQVSLGISTLLTHVAIPVAAAHQGGSILLLTTVLFFAHARVTEASRI